MRRSLTAIAVSATLVAAGAGSASAQRLAVEDDAGDASRAGLDITRAVVSNRDYSVVVRVDFDELARSDLIVSIDPRRARGVRLISQYRPRGTTRNFVVRGAFTDKGDGGGRVRCPGFRVTWDAADGSAILRLPDRCLNKGRYGAVRFSVLTERDADVDWAPENDEGGVASSAWIPRG